MSLKTSKAIVISSGLAIFSMFFGAGNLMYPIKTGIMSGNLNFYGISGFLITSVLLPLAGLVAMMLFDGDYKAFFARLGNFPGKAMLGACVIIIGPLIAIPRIVTVAHVMMSPFLPLEILRGSETTSLLLFSLFFLGVSFLGSFRENKIIDVLGYVISPLLVLSLGTLIVKGFITAGAPIAATDTAWGLFRTNVVRGYGTLDLIGAIFFASIVIGILKNKITDKAARTNCKSLAVIGLKAGTIGVGLLALVYIGQSFLGAHFGAGLEGMNDGVAFREIVFKVVGRYGAAIIGSASMFACFSTSIALGAAVAEYLQKDVLKNKIGYVTALAAVLLASLPLSVYGLDTILALTGGPITFIGYPALIALTFCNIGYKLFDFRPVKTPVLITFLIAFITYFVVYFDRFLLYGPH